MSPKEWKAIDTEMRVRARSKVHGRSETETVYENKDGQLALVKAGADGRKSFVAGVYPGIKKIVFNTRKKGLIFTTVLWADGSKTIVRCKQEDFVDYYTGVSCAIAKKFMGSNHAIWNEIKEKGTFL